jgi:tetratricopeptide (TPR) repeat protein
MANSALIEDLLKQFAENPRRVFARLANEYRKTGDLDVAIEICRAHVPLQPTYISGYIVLGQALFESKKLDEARSTFETALTLDPENLIALRQLGDIARASGDVDGARGWYHKLLEVDPQNDEIAAQLEQLDAPAAAAGGASGATGAAPAAKAEPVSWSDIHPDSPTVTPLSAQAMQAARPRFTIGVIPENLPADAGPVAREEATSSAPAPVAESRDEALEPEAQPAQRSGSLGLPEYVGGFDRHSPTPPTASPAVPVSQAKPESNEDSGELAMTDIGDLAPEDPDELDADLPPLQTTSEHAASRATAAELAELFAGPELETPKYDGESSSEPASAGATRHDDPTFDEEPYDPTIGRMLDLSGRTSTDALLPDLMMTESGAELLREQGHIDQAIYVYRHLAAKNPDDTSYAERIAALERGAHSSIPIIASISAEVISAAQHRSHSTQSIRSFFTSLATRRTPASPSDAVAAKTDTPSETPSDSAPPADMPAPAAEHASDETESSQDPWSAASLEHTTSFAVPPEAVSAPAATEASTPSETVSDADRSALETLFSGNSKIADDDERAANSLASAFSEEFAKDVTGPAGQPTRAAADALSLDAVFQSSRTRADGERANQPTVSFDQFFAHREGGGAPQGKSDTAVETASHDDDSQSDLELFHEWLDGLKK